MTKSSDNNIKSFSFCKQPDSNLSAKSVTIMSKEDKEEIDRKHMHYYYPLLQSQY